MKESMFKASMTFGPEKDSIDPAQLSMELFREKYKENKEEVRKFAIEEVRKQNKAAGKERINEAHLRLLGWADASSAEIIALNAALEKYNITKRESIIMFLATCAAESGYGRSKLEDGDDAYFALKDYSKEERGVGYIQLTFGDSHKAFLIAMHDDYMGADTAEHIDENYGPWESAAWAWSEKLYGSGWRLDDYAVEKRLCIETFLSIQYYINGYPTDEDENVLEGFSDNISGIVNEGFKYKIDIPNNKLRVNGREYPLPKGWEAREEAYYDAINACS